ncbi:MAG: glycosyltransferase [Myxacorys californica WJT36-NPBG1]|jgi:glycosyltransferase involved in cell wall biosynthesis|nr:glycosyltransferase [Myxacorys californica WJT36-NPBG1]
MIISVIIPSYRRPNDLNRCLNALKQQIRPVDEVIVVVRDTDAPTWRWLESFDTGLLNLRSVTVSVPGVIAAMNAGLDNATGDIIAFTDDDAAPHTDWLARIEAHYLADPSVGGVGGRDWVYHGTRLEGGSAQTVGQVQWFGRVIGNHHIGVGGDREVDVLKGVNMSFRKSAINALATSAGSTSLHFDDRLKGTGAQVHFEIAFSLAVKRRGWKLIYDPAVAVDHYPAHRFDEDQRAHFNALAWSNQAHNEVVVVLDHLSVLQRLVYWLWMTLVGTRDNRGIVQLVRFLPQEKQLAVQKWLASHRGRSQGWQTWRHKTPRPHVTTKFGEDEQSCSTD